MAQRENDGRQSELSQNTQVAGELNSQSHQASDKPETSQGDGRQWTLRRIEGVIGSIA